jgi:hypothetical protein
MAYLFNPLMILRVTGRAIWLEEGIDVDLAEAKGRLKVIEHWLADAPFVEFQAVERERGAMFVITGSPLERDILWTMKGASLISNSIQLTARRCGDRRA